MPKFVSHSANETKQIAEKLAKVVQKTLLQQIQGRMAHPKSNIFALTGELGAGKTIFAQGFAKGLGIKEKIISPTFVLIRQHQIPNTQKVLFHIDLYRLENITDLKSLGLEEILSNPNNIVLIEWAEKIKDTLPENTTWVYFKTPNEQHREIIMNYPAAS